MARFAHPPPDRSLGGGAEMNARNQDQATTLAGCVRLAALAVPIVVACTLGGTTTARPWAQLTMELSAIPALVLALFGPSRAELGAHRFALVILTVALAIPLMQLIPLPPAVWQSLPGRQPATAVLQAAQSSPVWLPLSVAPRETLRSAAALLVPASLFLATLGLRRAERRLLCGLLFALALAGLGLGVAQLACGESGPYLYPETSRGTLVGFFANRNHFATVLVALLPLSGAVVADRRGVAVRLVGIAYLPLALVGLGLLRSRAGILLAAPAVAAGGLLIWRAAGGRARVRVHALLGGAALAIVAVASLGLAPLEQRFAETSSGEFRFQAWPHVAAAAVRYFPAGAGVGTFGRAYAIYEPLKVLQAQGFEHAHNEYLEIALEDGIPGVLLLAGFLGWLAVMTVRTWRQVARDPLRAAASASLMLILAHACVDYSLRTLAVVSVLAALCGLVAGRTEASRRDTAPPGPFPTASGPTITEANSRGP